MLISHETPIDMLHISKLYNDYDYCLVHLLPEYDSYREFYFDAVKSGRHVLLDNSIFELGTAYDSKSFAEWITKLNPTEYIVPDVLEDCKGTQQSFTNFTKEYKNLPGNVIGVVQGKTYNELVECYKFMSDRVDKIAISFDYSYYLQRDNIDLVLQNKYSSYLKLPYDAFANRWCNYAAGRIQFLLDLIKDGVFNKNKNHHLLGCSVPWEFNVLKEELNAKQLAAIHTIDTSNPIVAGLLNVDYNINYGLVDKWSCKLVDFINSRISSEQKTTIQNNIWKFRNLCK